MLLTTFSGRQLDPLNPRPEDIEINDIAHSLSNLCRYGGHSRKFYSVAQHSVRVALLLPRAVQLAGLLHDAAEAYVVDIPTPLKRHLPLYGEVEEAVELAIRQRFDYCVPLKMYAMIKEADNALLWAEWSELMSPFAHLDGERPALLKPDYMEPMTPAQSKTLFLRAFDSIINGRTIKQEDLC